MEENEKPYSKLQWIYYIVLIPTIFTLLLTGIIFTFLGYNVIDAAKSIGQKIPGLSLLIETEDQGGNVEDQLQQTEEEMTLDQNDFSGLETELQQKEMKILELEQQIEQLQQQNEQERISREERNKQIRELAKLYGGMSASRSAAILENLTLKEAAQILNEMNTQQRTSVMGKLNPSFAAQLTVTMKEMDLVDDPDFAALQERVQVLMNILDASVDESQANSADGNDSQAKLSINNMVNTFSQLPPNQAAKILEEMSKSDSEFKLASKILAVMSDESRSAIFAVMDIEIAQKYTSALVS